MSQPSRTKPGAINPDAGEPNKGAPEIGTTGPDGDDPYPPDPKASPDGEAGKMERGQRASFDPRTGDVHGSGSGTGGGGNRNEDFDHDPMAGAEPLPTGAPGQTPGVTRK